MEWTNEWIEQGKAKGLVVGESRALVRLLRSRLGPDADSLKELILKLTSAQREELADELLNFTGLSDAQRWLAQRL